MTDSIVQQIQVIMAKAQDPATTEAEREMLQKRAQILSTRHGLDAALLRQKLERSQRRETPIQKTVQIGKKGQLALALWCELFMSIGRQQDLQFNIAQNSTYVVAFGFPTDIEVTETLYASLLTQMVEEANAYLKSGAHREETQTLPVKKREPNPEYRYSGQRDWRGRPVPKYLYHWTYEEKPVSGMTARKNFYETFTREISRRLRDAKAEAVAHFHQAVDEQMQVLEQVAASAAAPTDGALVLKEKREEVDEFYRSTSRARGSWGGNSRGLHSSSSARVAGAAAGQRARLGGGSKAIGGGGGRAIG